MEELKVFKRVNLARVVVNIIQDYCVLNCCAKCKNPNFSANVPFCADCQMLELVDWFLPKIDLRSRDAFLKRDYSVVPRLWVFAGKRFHFCPGKIGEFYHYFTGRWKEGRTWEEKIRRSGIQPYDLKNSF